MESIFQDNDNLIPEKEYDVLIIGSGIAGLSTALELTDYNVAVLTKGKLRDTSTWYAQGGVAVVLSNGDSIELHVSDTLKAGAGLCDEEVVRLMVKEGPPRIHELIELGVDFDTSNGQLDFNREGGHSMSRVIHSGDSTGSAIQQELMKKSSIQENIDIYENSMVVDLLVLNGKCCGVATINAQGKPEIVLSNNVILTTGGAGQLFEITTNPKIATADGLAMAFRAGVRLRDLEFIQFHPTALGNSRQPKFLITEALRGEGAFLRDCKGERFMIDVHPLAELAPRDVVTREIVEAMKRCSDDHVWLDARQVDSKILEKKFPTIIKTCFDDGFDLKNEMIPVQPAAHFFIGGILTDLDGKTSLPGLYACGEVASTGVHGANRLASNSLLEGLVFSKRIVNKIKEEYKIKQRPLLENFFEDYLDFIPGRIIASSITKVELQELMTDKAGLIRDEKGLSLLIESLEKVKKFGSYASSRAQFEVGNMIDVAGLIAQFALRRRESRGVHFRSDYPQLDDANWKMHQIYPFN